MRNLWEDHVEGLTRQMQLTQQAVETLEQRIQYYEDVLITLITALKQGGVIVDDESGENQMPS